MKLHTGLERASGAKAPFCSGAGVYGLKPVPFNQSGTPKAHSGISKAPSSGRGSGLASGRAGEEGYILLAVLIMVVMVLITLSIAAPKVAADIERDREVELQHRGLQYRRAIQLYYRKFNAYPPNMDALVKTSEIRFLRKRYKDPATGKDEWKLIRFGENKTPTAMGFFGQPIAGSTIGGTGPGGVGQNAGTPVNSAFGSNAFGGSAAGGSSGFGGSGSSGFGSSGSSFGSSGSSFGSSGSSFGSSSPTSPTTDPSSGGSVGAGTAGTTSTTGTTDSGSGSGSGTTGSTTSSSSTFGGSGQSFGGGGIIGVESTSPKATILEYKKKKHFNEWEFTYDPISERLAAGGGAAGAGLGQPAGGPGNSTSPFTNSPGFGGGQGNSNVPPPNGGFGSPSQPTQQNPNQQQ